MGIKVVTYGGKFGWFLRKHFSSYTSKAYLEMQYFLRKSLFKRYIEEFEKECFQPCIISIETINRCNSTCDFCPANKNAEKRPFKKMSDELFQKIIAELADMDYSGYLNLYVNNEPFIDVRIEDLYKYAKDNLPNAKMLLYTNGTLITQDRFHKIIPYVDKMIINNYSETLELHSNLKELIECVKSSPELLSKDIIIQIRYIHEILTNRAGFAPNKKTGRINHKICIMPYTDIIIYPDGVIGLCCSDAIEKTNLGNVNYSSLQEIWSGNVFKSIRKSLGKDRNLYGFCQGCDFVDAGIRNTFMKNYLRERGGCNVQR
ncbi:MAG: SPASM domain-containing protein [Acetatifactor sp.]|nr:SPASM domain-containing protein [Acetatifactor sp.]